MESEKTGDIDPVMSPRIFEILGIPVLLDSHLASIYGVPTKALNQAVKRSPSRFPADFSFVLTLPELGSLRSQTVTAKNARGGRRNSPRVFTEHGAIMAASVLNSPRAVEMSVFVVRAFVRLRDFTRTHADLARQLAALERRVTGHDTELKQVLVALRQLLQPPAGPRRPIGFKG